MTWDMIESKWTEMTRRVQGHLPQDIDAVSKPMPRAQTDVFAAASATVRGPRPLRGLRDSSKP